MGARADAVVATRERIVAVAVELFYEHAYEDVTLAGIAKAAGVSHQTVLNHFESKEGVVLAVAEKMTEETTDVRYRAEPGDVVGAVRVLVGQYEEHGDANVRWAMTADRLPTLGPLLDGARAFHQDWLRHMFGGRVGATGAARKRTVNALHAATDVYTWKLLRRDLGLSRSETEKTIVQLVEGLLDATSQEHTR
ncbi:MAG: TetR/AcrR family transcriptional regulator [Ilumatobacteraceae bacterium]